MVDAEQLVDLPDLERGGELLAYSKKVALREGGRANDAGEGAVGRCLGGDAAAGGESALMLYSVLLLGEGKGKREEEKKRG